MGMMKTQPEEVQARAWDWLEDQVLADPEIGPVIKRALKKKDPRVNFPELDLHDAIEAKTTAADKKIDDFLEAQRTKENKTYWEGQRKAAKEKYSLDDEDTKKIEAYMIESHVGNYDAAARIYALDKSATAEPTNYQDMTGVQLPAGKGLFDNPVKWARDEGLAAINDIRRQRVA